MFFFWRIILIVIVLALVMGLSDVARAENTFYVLINESNGSTADDQTARTMLRHLYLKQQTAWPDGEKALFFARKNGSEEETAFRRAVLGMSDTQLDDHWLKMKQMRGVTPPRAVSSTRLLLRQLRARRSAVAVFSEDDFLKHAKDDPRITILTTFTAAEHD